MPASIRVEAAAWSRAVTRRTTPPIDYFSYLASTGHSGRSADLSLAALSSQASVHANGFDARYGYLRDTRLSMVET